jgi:two-component system response regulator PrrA
MFVDDNQEILEAAARFFSVRGVDVRTANTPFGVSAALLRDPPDALVLDVSMPGLDGGTLAQLLKSQRAGREVPIILYSALPEEELYVLAKQTPNTSYVLKSEGLGALFNAIVNVTAP